MGLVLVFDLDQTIIDSSDPFLFTRPNTPDGIRELRFRAKSLLNFTLVNSVIKRAARLRGKKDSSGNDIISGIFLLTNNSSKIMVSGVDSVLRDEIAISNPEGSIGKYKTVANKDPDTQGMPDQSYFFDSILMREHSGRTPGQDAHSPVKNLQDVKRMLGFIDVEISDDELTRNTFFFDDMDHPGMTLGSQYIKIEPPFRKYSIDYTNYTPILKRLSELDGEPIIRQYTTARTPLTVSRTISKPTIPLVKQRTIGRNRSNTLNEGAGNNMGLPLSQQESTVRATAKAKPSISSIFTGKPIAQYTPRTSHQSPYRPKPGESMKNFMKRMGENTSGGTRKTRVRSRTRKHRRNKTRKCFRK